MARPIFLFLLLCFTSVLLVCSSFQQNSTISCFSTCACDDLGLISCMLDNVFEKAGAVQEFNTFLLNRSKIANRIHFTTKKNFLPKILIDLTGIFFLSFAGNMLTSVDNDTLTGMPLRELNLSRNRISTFHPQAFEDLPYLQTLDLSYNQLQVLSHDVFRKLTNLETLLLDHNNLTSIPFSMFSDLPRLRKLILNNNLLSYITPGVSLLSLKTLIVNNNRLTSFIINVGEDMPRLGVLDVSGNPFHCSCAVIGLMAVIKSSTVAVLNSSGIVCSAPTSLAGKTLIEAVLNISQECSGPSISQTFDSQSVLYASSMQLNCDVSGDPSPAILWITPWGHKFTVDAHQSQLEDFCTPCMSRVKYRGKEVDLISEVSVTADGRQLIIKGFRNHFSGNFTCLALNYLGNDTVMYYLQVKAAITEVKMFSLFIGACCAAGFLLFGFIVGFIKLIVKACRNHLGAKKNVICTPIDVASQAESAQSVTQETLCKEDSFDLGDDFYPPETPFTTPVAASPTASPKKVHADGDHTPPPGGWIPSNLLDTMEEVRWRLRYGMGRKMETVKRNVMAVKESGTVYMHNIMESGSTAANRVKAGVVLGVETVKYHVQSIKEFCGTGDMGVQTISMISVETNVDTNERREIVRSITLV